MSILMYQTNVNAFVEFLICKNSYKFFVENKKKVLTFRYGQNSQHSRKKVKWSEFIKIQNGAVNVSNQITKRSILLNYPLLHINKVFWKLFRIVDGKKGAFNYVYSFSC
jgi:hypothetical protein